MEALDICFYIKRSVVVTSHIWSYSYKFIHKTSIHFRYLLGKDGFNYLDPFVPVNIPEYDKKELYSCMEYYRERKWVQPYPGQDEEVAFISAMNPFRLMKICDGL